MLRFAAARAGQALIVAFIVTSLAFLAIHLAPGDPFALSPGDPPELAVALDAMRRTYGLDRPLWEQYPAMLGHMARGDFGTSYGYARPVTAVIADVIPRTLLLTTPALVLGVLLGAALGTWQGARAGRASDRVAGTLTLAVLSVPEFILALLVSTVLALRLDWFPATGMRDLRSPVGGGFLDVASHMVLPVATLVIVIAAVVARYHRATVVDALDEDFVRAARAKGAPWSRILLRHVLRRTAAPLCTVIGLLMPLLVSGVALVEMVFNWPGAGSTLLLAVTGRDYPLAIALVLLGSVAVSLGTALADLAAMLANPAARVRA